MLSAAIDSVAICHIATRDLFEEDLQNCNSDFIDPSKLLLASSLSPSPIRVVLVPVFRTDHLLSGGRRVKG
jgi:hypothetical protein